MKQIRKTTLYNPFISDPGPSCYELHAKGLRYCASDTDTMKEAFTSYREHVHLWRQCWRRVRNDSVLEESILGSERISGLKFSACLALKKVNFMSKLEQQPILRQFHAEGLKQVDSSR